ncbi:MAG: hypothetical protein JXA69_00810 [Phycisphaerae bacterium]|nr:hypothetical protein [Phycisphaerae bacterium]
MASSVSAVHCRDSRATIATLMAWGGTHLAVDAASVAVALRASSHETLSAVGAWGVVVAYNVLAFAGQAPLGLVTDRWRFPRLSAVAGCILVACAVPAAAIGPILAVCLAGLGNALFHVGGGAISLSLTPGRATGPGLFVAPGALGVAIGVLVGRDGAMATWPFLPVLAGALVTLLAIKPPPIDYRRRRVTNLRGGFGLVLVLLCAAIAVRSIMGAVAVGPWKPDMTVVVFLALAAVAGKASGGILADRFGWLRVATTAMLVAMPFVVLGMNTVPLAIAGMVLLQIPMSITVAAIARLFPGAPAFSFGLASLVLVIGAIQVATVPLAIFGHPWVSGGLLLTSTAALFAGLRLLLGAPRADVGPHSR